MRGGRSRGLPIGAFEGGHAERRTILGGHAGELVGVIFHRIVGTNGRVIAVLPRAIGEVESAHGGDDLFAEHGVERLVVGVPDGDARMIPVVAHPLTIFADHLRGIEAHLIVRAVPAAAGPHEIFVLDQQAGLVGDFEPAIGRRADAEAEGVPVHLLGDFDEEFAHPFFVPGQDSAFRILEETVQRDVGSAQEVRTAVEVGAAGGGLEVELAHAEAGGGRVTAGGGFEHVKVGVFGRPELRVRHRDRSASRCAVRRSRDAVGEAERRRRRRSDFQR